MTFSRLKACALTAAVAVLGGSCSPAPQHARHTVQDYRADAALRRGQLALCENNPGSARTTPDCINAREAARLEGLRSLRELPPVRLPPPKSSTRDSAGRPAKSRTNGSSG